MLHRLDYFPGEELVGHYRKVFSTNEGKEVLAHILVDLGMFLPITDGSEDIALKNYAVRLIEILTGNPTDHGGGPTKDNVQNFMVRLMKQPITKIENND